MRPLCGLSEACLLSSYGLPKATLGILDRLQTLLGSRQACCGLSVARHFGPPSNPRVKQLAKPSRTLPSTSKALSEASPAGRPAAASLWPVRGLPPLSAAGRPVAASLWPVRSLPPLFLWASEGCLLSSYGLAKATLGILDRLQTLLGSSAAGRPVAASLWPVRSLPPLFLWASEGDVRHFGPPSNPPRQLAGLPPLFLWASEGDVRHFGPPSNPRVKQLAKPSRTRPSTSKGLSEASPAGRPAAASLWPVRGLPPLSAAGRPVLQPRR